MRKPDHQPDPVTARLDEVYAADAEGPDPVLFAMAMQAVPLDETWPPAEPDRSERKR